MVLCNDPILLPKVNTIFHSSEEVILPSFSPNPKHPREQGWHSLDVHKAVSFYISRTASFRRPHSYRIDLPFWVSRFLLPLFPGGLGKL